MLSENGLFGKKNIFLEFRTGQGRKGVLRIFNSLSATGLYLEDRKGGSLD